MKGEMRIMKINTDILAIRGFQENFIISDYAYKLDMAQF